MLSNINSPYILALFFPFLIIHKRKSLQTNNCLSLCQVDIILYLTIFNCILNVFKT